MTDLPEGNILLATCNARYTHSCPALYYLKATVRDLPGKVFIREWTLRISPEDMAEEIGRMDPALLGLSVYIWNSVIIEKLLEILDRWKQRPVIILGGPEVSCGSEKWLDHPSVRAVIRGPGEAAFRSLLLEGVTPKGVMKVSPLHLDEIPFPYDEEDLANLANRYIYYESSRGCPRNCTYCLSSREDIPLQFRETGRVLEEIDRILAAKPELVKFIDRTFNTRPEHYRTIWRHIIEKWGGSATTFHFEIMPGTLEEDDFTLLEQAPAGLFQFEVGIQSTTPEALLSVNRKGEWQKARDACRRLLDATTIHLHVDQLVGLPGEGPDRVRDSFNNIFSLGADHFQVGILKLLPGTPLREQSEQEEGPGKGITFNREPPYRVRSTPLLRENDIDLLEEIARLVDILYNSGGFPVTLGELLRGVDSPFNLFQKLQEVSLSIGTPERGWEDTASFCMKTNAILNLLEREFLLDCLRWDWCSRRGSNRYPALLKSETTRLARKEAGKILSPKTVKESLQTGIWFMPETEGFRDEYMEGRSLAWFPARPGKPALY